jgi:hypothetical protein
MPTRTGRLFPPFLLEDAARLARGVFAGLGVAIPEAPTTSSNETRGNGYARAATYTNGADVIATRDDLEVNEASRDMWGSWSVRATFAALGATWSAGAVNEATEYTWTADDEAVIDRLEALLRAVHEGPARATFGADGGPLAGVPNEPGLLDAYRSPARIDGYDRAPRDGSLAGGTTTLAWSAAPDGWRRALTLRRTADGVPLFATELPCPPHAIVELHDRFFVAYGDLLAVVAADRPMRHLAVRDFAMGTALRINGVFRVGDVVLARFWWIERNVSGLLRVDKDLALLGGCWLPE